MIDEPEPRRMTRASGASAGRPMPPQRPERAPLPDALLRRVKQFSGRMSTEAVHVMQEQLPFFADLDASQRSNVQLIIQTSVVDFLEWVRDPESDISFSLDAFQAIPQDLARRLTFRQTVDMVRAAMEFFEQWLPALARNEEQLVALTEAILRYGRELGFAAASVYASAAESRGAWDTRLEALVVDAVVRGDTGSDMQSRAATLNWDATASATVLIGSPPPEEGVSAVTTVHTIARAHGRAALAVVQGEHLVMVVSGELHGGPDAVAFRDELMYSFSKRSRRHRSDHSDARVGARVGGRGDGGHGGRGRLAGCSPSGPRDRVAARTCTPGRPGCDHSARRRRRGTARGRRFGPFRHLGRIPRQWRCCRVLLPKAVCSSKYRPVQVEANH